MFELTQTAELSHWQGEAADPAWVAFLGDVRRFVGKASVPQAGAPSLQSLVQIQPEQPGTRSALASDRIGLAVLPFLDLTGAKDQAAFLDGLGEELGALLTRNANLALAGAAGVPRDPARDLRPIAQALGVHFLLDGSVRGSGGRLRVTVRLVAAQSGTQLWQERYDGDQADDFDLQERVAAGVAAQISTPLLAAELERAQALAPEARTAFENYNLGLALSMDWRRASLEQARAYALAALRVDPSFPLAQGLLGFIYSVMFQSTWDEDPAESLRLGLEQSARALNAAERDLRVLQLYAAAHISFGRDMMAVESMLAKALMRAPEDPTLMASMGWVLLCQGGRTEHALALFEDGMVRDPDAPAFSFSLLGQAANLLILGRFSQAISPAREAVLRRPDYMFAELVLASALGHAGHIEEAKALCAGLKRKGRIEIILPIFRNADERALVRRGLELAGLDA